MKIGLFLLVICSLDVVCKSYNVKKIVRQLHQQFCTIVEVGEGFCNLFVEFRSSLQTPVKRGDYVAEVFLGVCSCSGMTTWEFCDKKLASVRPNDCLFSMSAIYNSSARVHRRLCDLNFMESNNAQCNCSHEFAGQTLYPVTGFNTCYRTPLPDSICKPRNTCGVAKCIPKTLFGTHLVQCASDCKGRQPFCEDVRPRTARYRTVSSLWSTWTRPVCNLTSQFLESESVCIDTNSKTAAFDCLGPGIFCCPPNFSKCKCDIINTGDAMKVRRSLRPCQERQYYSSDTIIKKYYSGDFNDFLFNVTELASSMYPLSSFIQRNYRHAYDMKINNSNGNELESPAQTLKHFSKKKRKCGHRGKVNTCNAYKSPLYLVKPSEKNHEYVYKEKPFNIAGSHHQHLHKRKKGKKHTSFIKHNRQAVSCLNVKRNLFGAPEIESCTHPLQSSSFSYKRMYRHGCINVTCNSIDNDSDQIVGLLNQSAKGDYEFGRNRINRDLASKSYSSCWEPTESYSDLPKKERLEISETHKQHNWDELEPKNKDPWDAGLLLEQEDMSYYMNNSNASLNDNSLLSSLNSSYAKNLSSIVGSLVAALYRNQYTLQNSFSEIPEFKNHTEYKSTLKPDSLISINESSLIERLGNKNMFPQNVRPSIEIANNDNLYKSLNEHDNKMSYFETEKATGNENYGNSGISTVLPAYLKTPENTSGMQIIEINLNKVNEFDKNANTDPNNMNNTTTNSGVLYLYSKEEIKNKNVSANKGDSSSSFVLPIHLGILNISKNSANICSLNTNATDYKRLFL